MAESAFAELLRQAPDKLAYIEESTENAFIDVEEGRIRAHLKHGDQSIEALDARDPRWLSILVEEVGEAAHELTYDASGDLRAELVDVLTVATAWLAALDREGASDEH